MRRSLALLGAVVFSSATALARPYAADLTQVVSLDDLYELANYGEIDSDELDLLVALYNRPLNLNRADRYFLYDLPEITLELADALIKRRAQGALTSVEQLLEVEGIDRRILESVRPFVTVDDVAETAEKPALVRGKSELGGIWRAGFGRPEDKLDLRVERPHGPQTYLRVDARGFDHFGAGLLATERRRTVVFYDQGRGALVSEGPANLVDLDAIYGTFRWQLVSAIAGSYTAGFAERVTFDTTDLRSPNGWRESGGFYLDQERGTLRPDRSLFGAAVSLEGIDLPTGWIDATVFVSSQEQDLYQYDFNYVPDDVFPLADTCETDSQCPSGYRCGQFGHCVSTRIYEAGDLRSRTYRYETLYDAYRETLVGGHAAYNYDDRTRLGVTAYGATIGWQVSDLVGLRFAAAAAYPNEPWFGAVGVDGRWGMGIVDVSGEAARSFAGGNALFVRSLWKPARVLELGLSGRYYDPDYKNPHSRGQAAPDEAGGVRARNEAGGRLDLAIWPLSGLELTTALDVWRRFRFFSQNIEEGTQTSLPYDRVGASLIFAQRIRWSFTSQEAAWLKIDIRDKDTNKNGRAEAYGDSTIPHRCVVNRDALNACYDSPTDGPRLNRGERYKLELGASTERLRWLSARLSYAPIWEDAIKRPKAFDVQHFLRLRLTFRPWQAGKIILGGTYWIHPKKDIVLSDREEPQLSLYLEVGQRLFDFLRVTARYGLLRYIDDRDARYSTYHLGRLSLSAEF